MGEPENPVTPECACSMCRRAGKPAATAHPGEGQDEKLVRGKMYTRMVDSTRAVPALSKTQCAPQCKHEVAIKGHNNCLGNERPGQPACHDFRNHYSP